MRTFSHMSILLVLATSIACSESRDDFRPETIIALEQGALDRWGKGDPDGYFDIMAPDASYFDPTTERRIEGKDRLKAMIEPLRDHAHALVVHETADCPNRRRVISRAPRAISAVNP